MLGDTVLKQDYHSPSHTLEDNSPGTAEEAETPATATERFTVCRKMPTRTGPSLAQTDLEKYFQKNTLIKEMCKEHIHKTVGQ